MDRRDFMFSMLLASLFVPGCKSISALSNMIEDYRAMEQRQENISRIYDELPEHVYVFEIEVTADYLGRKVTSLERGVGVVLENHLISVAHNADASKFRFDTPYGNVSPTGNGETSAHFRDLRKDIRLLGRSLEEISFDLEDDILVCRLPSDLNVQNFPAKPSYDFELGDEVFIIGNPYYTGANIRRGYVSDKNGVENVFHLSSLKSYEENVFGTDIKIIPGDSGSPCVNSDFQLLGLYKGDLGGVSYAVPIREFMSRIN